jgi:hypothetical protein
MAHYALMDENNIVVQVITGRNEDEVVDGITDWEAHYAEVSGLKCKRTSYNTNGGVHHSGGVPYRITFAGIGMIYDENLDGFIYQQPYPSWILDTTTGKWDSPVPYPVTENPYTPDQEEFWTYVQEDVYVWNETNQSWDLG